MGEFYSWKWTPSKVLSLGIIVILIIAYDATQLFPFVPKGCLLSSSVSSQFLCPYQFPGFVLLINIVIYDLSQLVHFTNKSLSDKVLG